MNSKLYRESNVYAKVVLWLILCLGAGAAPAQASGESVGVWMTTSNQTKLLQQQTNVNFAPDSGSNPLTVTINPAVTYQQMDGFGAGFFWDPSSFMSPSQKTAMMRSLFDTNTGIGISFIRQPIALPEVLPTISHSYDDMPPGQTDPTLANFSIDEDITRGVIANLQQALAINPSIKLIGTPWSPPGWMKTSGNMIGGSLLPQFQAAYAQYFVKYIKAYQAQGIPIYGITIQNEPLYVPGNYPGMSMSAAEQAGFIKNHLGPAFAAAGLTTKIIAFDHNWDRPDYPIEILSDLVANAYTAGSAFHFYRGNVAQQQTVHNAFPNKDIWFTEALSNYESADPGFGPTLMYNVRQLMIRSVRYWAKGVNMWNLLGAGSSNTTLMSGDGTVMSIDRNTGNFTPHRDYYALGHASKFVRQGAYRIASNTFDFVLENVAFKNPDGSIAAVVANVNDANQALTFKITWGGQSFSYQMPGNSVATFKWTPSGSSSDATAPTSMTAPASGAAVGHWGDGVGTEQAGP